MIKSALSMILSIGGISPKLYFSSTLSINSVARYVFENFLKRHDIDENAKSLIEAYLHNLGNPFNKNNKEKQRRN